MLSLTRVSSGQAGTYYQADDYYLQEKGEWQGELADRLGFSGAIQEDDFKALIEGHDPKNRFTIQHGGQNNTHTAGVDLTFSAPKSVSLAGLVLDDKRVISAHDKAVSDTLTYIERNHSQVRIKENGKVNSYATGNMLAAKFQHVSSRELDPQLHTHCLIMNFTQKDNGDIRAMDYVDIYNNKLFLGQIYRAELAKNLKEIGYEIKSDNKGLFEIAGVDDKLMREFSTRSEQIKQKMEELRVKHPDVSESKLKEYATLESRQNKKEADIIELKQNWDQRVTELGYNKVEMIEQLSTSIFSNQGTNTMQMTNDINSIIKDAVNIATEQEAVVKKSDILRIAAKLGMGEHRINDLEKALAENKGVIKLTNTDYTTPEIAAMERKIVKDVITGRNKLTPILEAVAVKTEIARYEMNQGFNLTSGQKQAVEHILTAKDRIVAIQGDAGTGKTTMLDVVRTITDKNRDCEIVGLSFTGKAASEIEEASKIKSQTIASFLHSQDSIKGKTVVIDEASMLSIKDMNSLLHRCDENTRLILIGDTKQLQTIGQGKIFSSLQEKEVISVVRMSEVQRQKDTDYKDVVDKLGNKQVEQALNKLDTTGKITEINERQERLNAIIQAYMSNHQSTIIVTATNKDREDLNQLIRAELLANNKVKNQGITIVTRETKSIIGEEKSYGQSYAVGDLVIANTAGVIGKVGTEARVTSVDTDNHTMQLKSGTKTFEVDLKQNGCNLQVYAENLKDFAQGDKILFLKNDNGLKVKNGQTGYIKSIASDGKLAVKMDNGRELSINPRTQYNYLSHGYALTDYKSQGQTEKHVIYHADTQKGINYNQAYVAITRGKESVKIYTDNKGLLVEGVKQEQVKTTTLDYNVSKHNTSNNKYNSKIDSKDFAPDKADTLGKEVSKTKDFER